MALVREKVKSFAELVKFEHTLFALPFAYMGAILAEKNIPTLVQFVWITLAMVGARSGAMALNRIIDREIDACNHRTANRHLPTGRMKVREVMIFICISFFLFFYTVFKLSPAHVIYIPLIMFFLVGYSYTKRFTWLSHLVLGVAIGFAPMGGWIGVTQKMDLVALILGTIVALWIAGFDVIYATMDIEFDRTYGLFSMPLNLGLKRALKVARIMHFLVVILLLAVYVLLNLGLWFLLGVFCTAVLLYYEHAIISPSDLSRVDVAFFNVNGIISILLLLFTIFDVVFK